MKIAICFGTRPEIIKLSLLSKKMEGHFDVMNIFTGQHQSLYDDVKSLIPKIYYKLSIKNNKDLCSLYCDLNEQMYMAFQSVKPDFVVVQGDTASSYSAAFCAFMMGIKVGHVEAGLRTYNNISPYPEEFNRQMISRVSAFHWCPSQHSVNNLRNEMANGKIINVGNTIVDTVNSLVKKEDIVTGNEIIVTLHRRENENAFKNIITQIDSIANNNKHLNFIFPAHPNPIIQKHISVIKSKNFIVVKPYGYEDFIKKLSGCLAIISDSGGIQEEAVCLGKKIIVCRNTTERPEAIDVGISKLVGDDVVNSFEWLLTPIRHQYQNPYGDGTSCEKIISSLKE